MSERESESGDEDAETPDYHLRKEAAEMARDLADSEQVVTSRPAAHRSLKRELDVDRIAHDDIRAGFEEAGWAYDRHVYFHPEKVSRRAAALAEEFRGEGRLLVPHSEILDRFLTPEIEEDGVAGWKSGDFVGVVTDAFEAADWRVDEVGGGSGGQRFYLFPLFDHLREHHPQGRYPLTQAELLSYYLAESVEDAIVAGESGDYGAEEAEIEEGDAETDSDPEKETASRERSDRNDTER